MSKSGYELLDSGYGRKLERFSDVVLARPCAQAVWRPSLPVSRWNDACASFDRENGNRWHGRGNLPDHWILEESGLKFYLSATDFGHLGIFPEQRAQWKWIRDTVRTAVRRRPVSVLNLFAYSGASTLAAAAGGAAACHLDASRGMVQWASENAVLNGFDGIRWIVDDAHKFMTREIRRGRKYDAVILDPPTFGRGESGEMYKIERDLVKTLDMCAALLSGSPLFILLSSHTAGCTPQALDNLLSQTMEGRSGRVESGEMLLTGGEGVLPLPSGAYARWVSDSVVSGGA